MNRLFQFVGRALFYITWPLLYVQLRWSTRTRVLLVHGQEVLVIKGWLDDSKWRLPGGGLHRQEPPEQSAIREVAEEIGIQLDPKQLKLVGEAHGSSRGLSYHYFQFVAELTNKPELKLQRFEVTHAEWLPTESLTKKNADIAVLDTLRSWSEFANRANL